jgi:hypothetical protein
VIVTYIPAVEDVVEELVPRLWDEPDITTKVLDILMMLKEIGYEVSRQVEITGPMEDALRAYDENPPPRTLTDADFMPRRIGGV